jgi:NAD(P)-dependent dehydrogenase (short-subunit alcohol dehydrogenase family)
MTTPTRVSLVTGGSRGIGRETAARLAADGHAVAILYLSNQAEADAAVGSITEVEPRRSRLEPMSPTRRPSLALSRRSRRRSEALMSSSTLRASCPSLRSPSWR